MTYLLEVRKILIWEILKEYGTVSIVGYASLRGNKASSSRPFKYRISRNQNSYAFNRKQNYTQFLDTLKNKL